MTKLLLVVSVLTTFAFAQPPAKTSIKLGAKALAIKSFQHRLTAGLDKELLAQEADLLKAGLKINLKGTDATLLGGQSGFAGNDQLFLVTIPAVTSGANPTTKVLAATVKANDYRQSSDVAHILTAAELKNLMVH